AVPLGQVSALAVYDFTTGEVSTIALPQNSGASGVAFVSDSVVYVANSNLNTVSVVDIARGSVDREIPVGVFPQAIVARQDRVFVLNGELDSNFQPARRGTITVIDAATHAVTDTVRLSGYNPTAAAWRFDGRLYVVNSGTFGQADGSVSVVNAVPSQEVAHYPDFAEFPGDIAFDAFGIAYVSSFAYGIAVWDPDSRAFVNPPSAPLIIDGYTISSGVGFDRAGRLYTLIPGDCIAPGAALRTLPGAALVQEFGVGVCPIDITFTTLSSQ
ncbi:MAG: YncE family protein, partial [Gemmatimonadota bacterium]